ncbi:LuxR C-terminal-related transcriptional regulator [Cupriavidus sp.]|uniref:LuxR C-terminal-related transcriptional regulator n=1 Tax=Cupriavidus sp. TaxID=1873897 RepID=UPI0028BEEED5|nr:LuxR C-terminal-related transcriptional regulator [Cupriavidus sp.]
MVASPCILPKIVPPRPASDAISRKRLIGRLQAASDRKLVLLTGGAGFGKTTLMAQWRQRLDRAGARVAWLTLAMQDGALPTFRGILAGALGHAGLAIEAGEGGGEALIASLLEVLARTPADVYLMIDDFHHVQDPATLALVQALIDAILPGLHLVIASRTVPALRLGRLRAMEEFVEIDGAELTFDFDETAAFLTARAGVPANAEVARQVHEITEGWPVGVRLAGRTRDAACDSPGDVPARMGAGDNGNLEAYLSEEVIDELPACLLDFMLHVSVLRSFQADLAAFVTSRDDAATLIDEILGRHVFLRRVDRRDDQAWYRFHPMFAAYLDKRRGRAGIDPKPLHRRAALWFVQQGRFADAMRSAALCDDLELATQLVDGGLPPAHSLAHLGVVARWTESVGGHRMAAHPRLLRMGAWAAALTARMDLAERWLTRLETTADADGLAEDPVELRHRLLLRAVLATHGDDEPAAQAALQGLESIPAPSLPGGLEDIELAVRLHWLSAQGHHLAARCLYSAPAARATRTGRGELALVAAAAAANVAMREGNALEAERIGATALRRARTIHGSGALCATLCAGVVAQAWFELDRLDEAYAALAACRMRLRGASAELKVGAARVFGRIQALREPPQDALAYFTRAEAHFRATGMDRGVVAMVAEQQRLVLSYGDRRHAQALQAVLDGYAARHPGDGIHDVEIGAAAALSRARLALAQDAPQEALSALETLRRFAAARGCERLQAVADLLQARALEALGRSAQAQGCAQSAVATCYRLGLHRTLIEEGAGLHPMLVRAAAHGGAALVEHVRARLGEAGSAPALAVAAVPTLASLPQAPAAPVRTIAATPGLTRREQEVLALLEQSMSNKRIALTLNISVQTVKWNLKKIFVKLQVTSRYEAIVAARKLATCEQ